MIETLKTRFNNIKYEHFKVNFKGLIIEVKLLDDKAIFPNGEGTNELLNSYCEEFKVLITNKDKTIGFKFYNSIMERGISEHLKLNLAQYPHGLLKIKEFKNYMDGQRWGGYDKIKNLKELNKERAINLLYNIVNCLESDLNAETESFKYFCESFGYDEDSRRAEKIFKAVQEQQEKLRSLGLTEEQITYLDEHAQQETEIFKEDIIKAIENAI